MRLCSESSKTIQLMRDSQKYSNQLSPVIDNNEDSESNKSSQKLATRKNFKTTLEQFDHDQYNKKPSPDKKPFSFLGNAVEKAKKAAQGQDHVAKEMPVRRLEINIPSHIPVSITPHNPSIIKKPSLDFKPKSSVLVHPTQTATNSLLDLNSHTSLTLSKGP